MNKPKSKDQDKKGAHKPTGTSKSSTSSAKKTDDKKTDDKNKKK